MSEKKIIPVSLANLENLNAHFIQEGFGQPERLVRFELARKKWTI